MNSCRYAVDAIGLEMYDVMVCRKGLLQEIQSVADLGALNRIFEQCFNTFDFFIVATPSDIEIAKEVFLCVLPQVPPHEYHVLRVLTHGCIPHRVEKTLRQVIASVQHFTNARSCLLPGQRHLGQVAVDSIASGNLYSKVIPCGRVPLTIDYETLAACPVVFAQIVHLRLFISVGHKVEHNGCPCEMLLAATSQKGIDDLSREGQIAKLFHQQIVLDSTDLLLNARHIGQRNSGGNLCLRVRSVLLAQICLL